MVVISVVQFVQGKTGFPWIDAIMRQLVSEGWIHHLARQAVGCFLTRGALWICWEEGFKVCVKSFSLAPWYLQRVYNWLTGVNVSERLQIYRNTKKLLPICQWCGGQDGS